MQVDSVDDQDWEFTQIWVKGYGVQTGSLHWSKTENMLYVGFDDGSVQRLKINEQGHPSDVSLNLFIIYKLTVDQTGNQDID